MEVLKKGKYTEDEYLRRSIEASMAESQLLNSENQGGFFNYKNHTVYSKQVVSRMSILATEQEGKRAKLKECRDSSKLYYFYPLQYHILKNFWKIASKWVYQYTERIVFK